MSSLKQIAVAEVRLGMFVHDIGVSWMSHPFWRAKFLLEADEELQTVRALGVPTIWIDTARGLDVLPRAAGVEMPATMPAPAEHPLPMQAAEVDPVLAARELCERARGVVMNLFREARIGNGVDAAAAQDVVEGIVGSLEAHPSALLSLVRLKTADDYTYMHSVAVATLMVSFANYLRLDPLRIRAAGLAGMLHDVGKARVSLDILNKPMELTGTEMAHMRRHPLLGHRLLVSRGGVDPEALDACLHHHEKFDGTGYPHGLVGEGITRLARMTAICDVYDAVTSDRPYKKAWDPAQAVQRMASWNGHFDPRLFRVFVRTVGIYPTGALLRLESGRLAVVVDGSRESLTQPLVRVFHSLTEGRRLDPVIIDLAAPDCGDRVAAREPRGEWPEAELAQLSLP